MKEERKERGMEACVFSFEEKQNKKPVNEKKNETTVGDNNKAATALFLSLDLFFSLFVSSAAKMCGWAYGFLKKRGN